jgi:hypothetical protein
MPLIWIDLRQEGGRWRHMGRRGLVGIGFGNEFLIQVADFQRRGETLNNILCVILKLQNA